MARRLGVVESKGAVLTYHRSDEWLERVGDAEFLNFVANDVDVISWVAGPLTPPLDLAPVVDDCRNVCLRGRHGFAVFHPCEPGIYFLHAGVLPKGRGRWALNALKAAIDVMFSHYATAIIATIPRDNRAARNLAAAAGFQLQQVFPDAWPGANGRTALHAYLLLRSDWSGPIEMRTH
jgi:hypothetical protein